MWCTSPTKLALAPPLGRPAFPCVAVLSHDRQTHVALVAHTAADPT